MEYVNSHDEIDEEELGLNDDYHHFQNIVPDMNLGEPMTFNTRDADQHADKIEDILDPQKFLQKHFGSENQDVVFKEVIDEVPDPIIVAEPNDDEMDEPILVNNAEIIADNLN